MELWIRSQDKLILTRMNEININYEKPTEIICNHYSYGEQYENYTFLGEYATKERALEVLDEIHQLLINLQTIELYNFMPGNTSNVYEMPKE